MEWFINGVVSPAYRSRADSNRGEKSGMINRLESGGIGCPFGVKIGK